MFNLSRNTFPVHYKLYQGQTEIVDAWGNNTGSYVPVYGEMQTAYMSVSSNRGTAEAEMFGTLSEYDRTITTTDISCPIDEDSVLWLDDQPLNEPHNYIVTKRAPWKNSISFAVKRVDVGE